MIKIKNKATVLFATDGPRIVERRYIKVNLGIYKFTNLQ